MTREEKNYQLEKINYYIDALEANKTVKYGNYLLSCGVLHDIENGRSFAVPKKTAKEAKEKAWKDYVQACWWFDEAKRDLMKVSNKRVKK